MPYEQFLKNLRANRFEASYFPTAAEAIDYLCAAIRGKTVGFGDSHTLLAMNAAERLRAHNTAVYDPTPLSGDAFKEAADKAMTAQVFLLSVNAAAETGELVNIDSSGNRVAGSLWGHEKVYFVFGANKIEPTLERAIWRARNVAAVTNASRFGFRTPCAAKGGRCCNCASPDRICNTLCVYMKKEKSMAMEAVLIGEELGY
ncbi:MAG: lactate utilization protein [Pyramidobacter sp.]|nr:lactate utilization protein [Pyramidobacter sp.]